MRSEFKEYEAENRTRKNPLSKMVNGIRLHLFICKIRNVKLGSEKWHKLQNKVSRLSCTTADCKIRSTFYEKTMGANCKGKFYCLPNVYLNFPKRIKLGYNLFLNRNVHIVARDEIVIGDNVLIGPNTVINSGSHNYKDTDKLIRDQGHKKAPIVIGNDVFIGGNAFILPGVHIGDGAVVGAGAVVTKSVEPYTVVAGNPAVVIGRRNKSDIT